MIVSVLAANTALSKDRFSKRFEPWHKQSKNGFYMNVGHGKIQKGELGRQK